MAQSLSQIYIHLVFSTKGREPWIRKDLQDSLHAYLAGILNAMSASVLQVGGMPDHVHLLFRLPRTMTLADVVKAAKVESSKWMKEQGQVSNFAWQAGYAAFSISASHVEVVRSYIQTQEEHHAVRTFQDEYRRLLKLHGIEYHEGYVWD